MNARFRNNNACARYNGRVTSRPQKSMNQRVDAPENTSAKNMDRNPNSRIGNTFFMMGKKTILLFNLPLIGN
jgi:hypothetical protein